MGLLDLEARFLASVDQFYNGNPNLGGPGNSIMDQPYLSWAPDSPDAEQEQHDSLMAPIGATERDVDRLTKFSLSQDGLEFLAMQELLQLSNTFSETQIIDPLFIVANAVPFIHVGRSLGSAVDFPPAGDTTQESPASLDPNIGGAGRLQVATSNTVIANALGYSDSVLSTSPLSNLITSLTNTFTLANEGSLGINQRPEFLINGNQMFSVLMWQGYAKSQGIVSTLDQLGSQLRVGNFSGVIPDLESIGNSLLNDVGLGNANSNGTAGTSGTNDKSSPGFRYFIQGADPNVTPSISYLNNPVTYASNGDPIDNTGFLYQTPYTITQGQAPPSASPVSAITSEVTSIESDVRTMFGSDSGLLQPLISTADPTSLSLPNLNTNPAEADMAFPNLSLDQRYQNDFTYISEAIAQQQSDAFDYWGTHKNTSGLGSINGYVTIGQVNNPDPRVSRAPTGYLRDSMNDPNNPNRIIDIAGDVPNSNEIASIYKNGQDYINVIIQDVVNQKAIPFRAFLSDIKTSVKPEYQDTKYIGRTERNIMYVGVTRNVTFSIMMHAFDQPELQTIWDKINYMTALCYPADYNQGYYVPSLIRVTLGGLYKNQPAIIDSFSVDVDPDVTWDLDDQIPITANMTFSINLIDGHQMTAANINNNVFYPLQKTGKNST